AIHPDVAGSTVSDSNYPDRPILDVDATFEGGLWYVWPQYLEQQEDYNPYGVYNIHNTVSDDGFQTMKELNKITADAYTKNHQIGDSLDAYMYETYNSYSGNLETGNMDIWLKVYHYDWINDPDVYGPETSMVGCTPDPAGVGWLIDVQANVDDMSSGFSDIQAAEWCEGAVPSWPGTAMGALDGAFDAASEAVIGVADTTGWALGYHTIWVRGQDAGNIWGEPASGTVEIKDLTARPDVEVTYPVGANNIEDAGTINIAWDADDVEDDADTLFIYINYTDDDGASWTPITSGLINDASGSSTYLWNIAAIPDGVNYFIKVEALDSTDKKGGDMSDIFSIDNIVDDEWFFQVEGPFALNMMPVNDPGGLKSSDSITGLGQFPVGAWTTTSTYTTTNSISGPWTFNVYGSVSAAGTTGRLYAEVYSGATWLATSALDDTDVTDTSALYTWTDTLAGDIATNGDAITVEIWLDVTSGGGATSDASLNPGFDTAAGPEWAYSGWLDTGGGSAAGAYDDPGGNPDGWVNILLTPAGAGPASEETYAGYWEQSFTTGFMPTSATLDFDWSCTAFGTGDAALNAIVFIDTASGAPSNEVWNSGAISGITGWASVAGFDVSGTVNADTTYYVKIAARDTDLARFEDPREIGFDNVMVSWISAAPTFNMEFDYGQTQSNVLPTIGDSEPPEAYDIYHTGALDNSWIFVSFPISVTGAVTTIFDDGPYGDSGTTWDRIYWYDPIDADHWKCYDPAYPGTQDMPNVDNTMGVWIHLVNAGGDEALTTGVEGSQPSGVTVNLVAGWNLVGYPADTLQLPYSADDLITDSGDGGMRIECFNAAAAYDIEVMPGVDNFQRGKAYMIYCTAAYDWIIP
ncbi:MAG: hypothetical protein KAS67_07645, partial [Thermoplasmata archaeon]|nr:hypothetical protein [Thermoplasmata archaeon]